jgi:hypothetical protein
MMDEPTRDRVLETALRGAADESAAAEVDWDALRSRISDAAQMPLARRRSPRAAPGRRALLSLAAAAAVAGLALALVPDSAPSVTAQERREIDAALSESLPDQVALLISGQAAEAALLEAAEED